MERIAENVVAFLKHVQEAKIEAIDEDLNQDKSLLEQQDASGRTALHFAAYGGDVAVIRALVGHGAVTDAADFDGNTPLCLAIKRQNKDAVAQLIELGSPVNIKTSKGKTPLHHAAATGDVELIALLVAHGAEASKEPSEIGSCLHWAVHTGNIEPIAFFLDEVHIPINAVDAHNGTVLHLAAGGGFADLVLFLLERGADPNAVAAGNSTPLHIAVEGAGNKEVIKHLLTFGAIDQPDSDGLTAQAMAENKGKGAMFAEVKRAVSNSYQLTDAQRLEKMEQFKAQGNKVFQAGEYSKGSKFYSLAITYNRTNHVLFSNRSACYFNLHQFHRALADAAYCMQLKPDWPKGYFRRAASLGALGKLAEAKKVYEAGLQLDAKNSDLVNGLKELLRKNPQLQ